MINQNYENATKILHQNKNTLHDRSILRGINNLDTSFEAAYLYRRLCLFQLAKYQSALDDLSYLIQ